MVNTNNQIEFQIQKRSYLRTFIELVFCLGLYLIIFFCYGTPFPYDYDSVNISLAIADSFNPAIHQPQPPGYLFHVLIAKLLYAVIPNPFYVQQVLNIIYIISLLVIIATLQPPPLILSVIATLPLLLYFCAAPVIYGASLFFSGLIFYEFELARRAKLNPIIFAITFATAAGFRQDLSLFMLPIVCYGFWIIKPTWRELILSITAFCVVCALWVFPTWAISRKNIFVLSASMFKHFGSSTSFFMSPEFFESLRVGLRFFLFGISSFGFGGLAYLLASFFARLATTALNFVLDFYLHFYLGYLFTAQSLDITDRVLEYFLYGRCVMPKVSGHG